MPAEGRSSSLSQNQKKRSKRLRNIERYQVQKDRAQKLLDQSKKLQDPNEYASKLAQQKCKIVLTVEQFV